MKIAVINGPNLNFLGIREPEVYGKATLKDLEEQLKHYNEEKYQAELIFFQSNVEGEIINFLQQCYQDQVEGIMMNPGAFTHYSYALTDAIKSISIPTVEVHISNIHTREEFRRHSVTAASCLGIISGFGFEGYLLALDALIRRVQS
ncbi:MAG: type II 3-dehydroquinate dehydratase [Cellulosilyticaceae bacterium]